MFQKKRVNIKHLDESRSKQKWKLGLQKLDPKQEKEEGLNLKLNLEVQQEPMKWGLRFTIRSSSILCILLDPTLRGDI